MLCVLAAVRLTRKNQIKILLCAQNVINSFVSFATKRFLINLIFKGRELAEKLAIYFQIFESVNF